MLGNDIGTINHPNITSRKYLDPMLGYYFSQSWDTKFSLERDLNFSKEWDLHFSQGWDIKLSQHHPDDSNKTDKNKFYVIKLIGKIFSSSGNIFVQNLG